MLVAGLIVALISLWALSGLAEEVLEGETLRFDEGVLHWIAGYTSTRMDGLALEITALGSWLVVLAIAVIAATLLALMGERWYALLLCIAVSGAWIIGPALKILFDRQRPQVVEWRVPHAGLSSFPSGHSTMGMVLFLTVAYVIHRLARRHWVTIVVMAAGTITVALIGLSRLYLGVHYPSDVLAGYAVGFAWSMFCAAGVELLRSERLRTRRSEPPPEEPPPSPDDEST
jgi:undecaprenyl-diphosphatase